MKNATKTKSVGFSKRNWHFGSLVRENRQARALEDGEQCYPIYRELRFAARIELEVLLDAVALDAAWRAERLGRDNIVLDAEGLYVSGGGTRKLDYCSLSFGIWAADLARAEQAKERLLALAGSTRIMEPMFTIEWQFRTGENDIESAAIEELANDVLHDAAYPEIAGGVKPFITRYLDAPETVLVLQGPPGTGKTRLLRAILGEMSRRKGENARAIYTGDMRALENDAIFVKFITGEEDAFVVEDADHVLKPRSDGNLHLHRFLTIADGVVRAQGRKIIFSTNLPNIGDLDEALIRPGRCFSRVHVRSLKPEEARALAEQVAGGDPEKLGRVAIAFAGGTKNRSLAEVYQAAR
ncbi:hypothetical protein BWI17_02150 [Betaproteobacteria bacterium GR16-43]|nr:hypothetical protein BWI17_02150 [Betaproteobacteria bacterium GR16-43]